jgi:carboxyl-terminal processing protease
VRVVEVPVDSVADRAGLREGDRLIAVDGQPVEGLSSRSLRERLTGEVGSFVSLRVVRGEQELTLRIERAPYQPRARDKPQ